MITTPYDTYTAARLINQSMPISYFMTTEKIITFSEEDYLDDIRDIMASKRHRDFPIMNSNGKYLGMISRRNLLGARGGRVLSWWITTRRPRRWKGSKARILRKSSTITGWEPWKP